ncbi:MAG: hypothetical protein V3R70_07565 [Syntrophobacteria bacterium]
MQVVFHDGDCGHGGRIVVSACCMARVGVCVCGEFRAKGNVM